MKNGCEQNQGKHQAGPEQGRRREPNPLHAGRPLTRCSNRVEIDSFHREITFLVLFGRGCMALSLTAFFKKVNTVFAPAPCPSPTASWGCSQRLSPIDS